ncbi:MAG: acyltransferase family protein [Steroidobacteraceae bacterium]
MSFAPARNPQIDLLRGVAILLVVVHHLYLRIPLEDSAWLSWLPTRVLHGIGMHGYEAVFLFFVISGFLITANALQRWGRLDRIAIGEFYARRFARIVPCLLALIILLSALHLLRVQHYTITHAQQSLPRAVAAALGFYLNWYEGRTGYLPANWDVLWSLSIEEVFYIGLPLLCLAVRRAWLLVPMLLALAISLPWTRAALAGNEIWQEKAYLPGMAAIATGVLAALLVARMQPPARGWTRALAVIGTLGAGAVIFADDLLWHAMRNFEMLILTGSAASLVIAAHWRTHGGTAPPWPLTAWIGSFGRLSYEIYLTHMFVVFSILELVEATGGDARFTPLWYVAAAAWCWVLGVAVDRGLSTPCNRSLRKWLAGFRAAQPST